MNQFLNLFLLPDRMLLKFSALIIKYCNLLTGKDNFWFARTVLIAGTVGAAYSGYLIKGMSIVPGALIVLLPLTMCGYWFVFLAEKSAECADYRRAKDFQMTICLFTLRHCFIVLSVTFLFGSGVGTLVLGRLFFALTVVFYLVSVDRPPHSSSKVWDMLKNGGARFVSLIFGGVLQPVPVRTQ